MFTHRPRYTMHKGKPHLFRNVLSIFLTLIVALDHSKTAAQDATPAPNAQPILRTNPDDVKLATLASGVESTNSSGDFSSDQWKSLAAPPPPGKDPMVAPTATQVSSPTNKISPLPAESTPKPLFKKDDYGPQTGWGIRTAVGAALQQSISARFAGGSGYNTFNFDPGFRMDGELFYNVTNGFYFGLEGGFIYNQISSIYSTAFPDQNLVAGSSQLGNASFYQVPLLANIRFQIPNSGKLRGYCTGGVGVVWDYITVSTPPTILGTYSQHQLNYAFQLGAGFQYNLLPGLDLDTSFKTFITPNPLIFSDGTSQVKASYNYALEIGLAYRF